MHSEFISLMQFLMVWLYERGGFVIIFNLFIDLPAAVAKVHQGNNASLLLNLTWISRSIRWCFIKAPQPQQRCRESRCACVCFLMRFQPEVNWEWLSFAEADVLDGTQVN